MNMCMNMYVHTYSVCLHTYYKATENIDNIMISVITTKSSNDVVESLTA